jgi:lipopolysaccharide biosynthesis protein
MGFKRSLAPMNPYEHRVPITKRRADDVNRHYAVGRWLLAMLAGDDDTAERAAMMARELGVDIDELLAKLKERIK